jgi:hypothetical protein
MKIQAQESACHTCIKDRIKLIFDVSYTIYPQFLISKFVAEEYSMFSETLSLVLRLGIFSQRNTMVSA